ncbi:MAG: sarcosine oxidase subunit gamma [Candidatus Competibacterales bacterium]
MAEAIGDMAVRSWALAEVYTLGRHGRGEGEAGLRVIPRRGLTIVQVAGYPEGDAAVCRAIAHCVGTAPAPEPCRGAVAADGEVAVLWNGPQRYWLVVPEARWDPQVLLAKLAAELDLMAALTDHSQGRVVLRLEGHALEAVLATGSQLDVHLAAMPAGWCRPTALDGVGCVLHRLDVARADLYIPRGYASSFFHWLLDAGAEFGVELR